jgi:hypothetical protein
MKNKQKGFIIPAMIAIVLILTIGGGGYVYLESKKVNKIEVNTTETSIQSTSTNTVSEKNNTEGTANTAANKDIERSTSSTSESQKNLSTTTIDSTTTVTRKTCSDSKCFTDSISTCSLASYQIKSQNELLGSDIKTEILFNLSKSNNDCLLELKLLSYNISATQGLLDSMKGAEIIGPSPTEIYPKLNKEMQDNYVGKSGICNITNNKKDISDLFKNNNQSFLIIDPDYKMCSGQLFVKYKDDII